MLAGRVGLVVGQRGVLIIRYPAAHAAFASLVTPTIALVSHSMARMDRKKLKYIKL